MKMKKHVIHEKQIGPLYTMILLKDKFWPLVDDIGNIGVLFLLVGISLVTLVLSRLCLSFCLACASSFGEV